MSVEVKLIFAVRVFGTFSTKIGPLLPIRNVRFHVGSRGLSGHAADIAESTLMTLAAWKLIHRTNVENTILQDGIEPNLLSAIELHGAQLFRDSSTRSEALELPRGQNPERRAFKRRCRPGHGRMRSWLCSASRAGLHSSQGGVRFPTGGMRHCREPASAFRKGGSADQVQGLSRRS